MIAKPSSCEGCPLYQSGTGGFVPDEIVEGAPVFVLGQNPGEDEEHEGRPFVGKTGQAMMADFFPAGGLIRGENVSIGNLIKCRLYIKGKGTNNLPTGATLAGAVAHCTSKHLAIPASTRLVVAQGAHAWRYASGTSFNISDWRGFLAPNGYAPTGNDTVSSKVAHRARQYRKRANKTRTPTTGWDDGTLGVGTT